RSRDTVRVYFMSSAPAAIGLLAMALVAYVVLYQTGYIALRALPRIERLALDREGVPLILGMLYLAGGALLLTWPICVTVSPTSIRYRGILRRLEIPWSQIVRVRIPATMGDIEIWTADRRLRINGFVKAQFELQETIVMRAQQWSPKVSIDGACG
ncbi:MAG TPA: PH domain-containing protein, partial [Phycisphaerae bacterium]